MENENENAEFIREEHSLSLINLESTKINFSPDKPVIEQILNKNIYNYQSWKNLSLCMAIAFVDGVTMNYFTYIVLHMQFIYNLLLHQIALMSVSLFLGVFIGSMITGYISTYLLRPMILKAFLLILCFFYFLLSFTSTTFIYISFRLWIGFLIGIMLPLAQSLIVEYLPIKHRSLYINITFIGYQLGCLFFLILMWMFLPNVGTDKLLITMRISGVLLLLPLTYICIFSVEAPRTLILKDKEHEAFEILENLNRGPLDELTKLRIKLEVKKVNKEDVYSDIRQIFSQRYLSSTILLSSSIFIISGIIFGTSLSFSFKIFHIINSETNITLNFIYIVICSFIGHILAGFLSEMELFGRKISIILGLITGSAFMLLSCLILDNFTFMFGLSHMFFTFSSSIISTYTCELYPTKMRDFGVGFINAFSRLGGLFFQFIFLNLSKGDIFLPYYASALLGLIPIALIIFLPYETHGSLLDSHHSLGLFTSKKISID